MCHGHDMLIIITQRWLSIISFACRFWSYRDRNMPNANMMSVYVWFTRSDWSAIYLWGTNRGQTIFSLAGFFLVLLLFFFFQITSFSSLSIFVFVKAVFKSWSWSDQYLWGQKLTFLQERSELLNIIEISNLFTILGSCQSLHSTLYKAVDWLQ